MKGYFHIVTAHPPADPAAGTPTGPRSTAVPPLWRNRDYLALLSGQTVSGVGISMSMFVFPLVVLAITGSTVKAGLAGMVVGLAEWIFTLPAGALVDRWHRKKVMTASEGIRALLFGSLAVAALLGHLTLWHLLVVAFAGTAVGVFFAPAETAALPRVVEARQLPTAMANNQARYAIAGLVGSPVGGALLQVSRAFPFVVTALTYAASWVSLLFVRVDLSAPPRPEHKPRLLADIREGLAFVWRHTFTRVVLIMAMLINLALNGLLLVVNLHLYQLGTPPAAIGAIDTIAGIAAVVGSLLAGRAMRRFRLGTIVIAVFWVFVLVSAPIPLTDNVFVIGGLIGIGMLVNPIGNSALMAYRVAITPDRLQGRSMSALAFLSMAITPLAPVLGGWLLGHVNHYVAMYAFVALVAVTAVMVSASATVRAVPRSSEWPTAPADEPSERIAAAAAGDGGTVDNGPA